MNNVFSNWNNSFTNPTLLPVLLEQVHPILATIKGRQESQYFTTKHNA